MNRSDLRARDWEWMEALFFIISFDIHTGIISVNIRLEHLYEMNAYFSRARVLKQLLYAAMTNPKEGEPGSRTNPLVRFGKMYVYSQNGDLVPYRGDIRGLR